MVDTQMQYAMMGLGGSWIVEHGVLRVVVRTWGTPIADHWHNIKLACGTAGKQSSSIHKGTDSGEPETPRLGPSLPGERQLNCGTARVTQKLPRCCCAKHL